MATATTGRPFGLAVCKHFGLDPSMVSDSPKIHTGLSEVFRITLDIALTAEDIEAIGKLMAD